MKEFNPIIFCDYDINFKVGYFQVEWHASGIVSGVYLYRMTMDKGFIETKNLVLLK